MTDRVTSALLLTLASWQEVMGERKIVGRTLLQKVLYFVTTLLGLKIEFVPYYYGPYSSEVAEELQALVGAGLVNETIERLPALDFGAAVESRRYGYTLTEAGRKYVEFVKNSDRELTDKISSAVARMKWSGEEFLVIKPLSIAAKMHQILSLAGKPVTIGEIQKQANDLGWIINEADYEHAVKFLVSLGLVKARESVETGDT
ncbi:MAG TPA: hypothetical protein EYP19_07920 [Desulfobacterales bacterium]|nr:hypothetical protein [Desulfobacterales bacterium]